MTRSDTYWPALELSFDVLEYLKGTGTSTIAAFAPMYFDDGCPKNFISDPKEASQACRASARRPGQALGRQGGYCLSIRAPR